ncbi:MAG: S24 family peptidase [Bacteroidales bacterium]|jgi:phage repressor protein C with HTH and peptisase S24 domain|nr:S24 family peptidase [Bacteroidales bacterium]
MDEITTIKQRILQIAEFKGVAKTKFLESNGLTYGNFKGKSLKTDISAKGIVDISANHPDINLQWLLTGNGEMLIEDSKHIFSEDKKLSREGVPYWDLPVSAGKSVVDVIGKRIPTGYIQGLPNADLAESILPVQGFSMEPEISNGALIGVRKINNWEGLNTERIYLIITHDDRMVKRIREDNEDKNVLHCISPNYPEFKIHKTEIIEIQRVCFVYNPK